MTNFYLFRKHQTSLAHQVTCYRLKRDYLILGIVGTAFFLCTDIFTVYAAYWNIDGSFPHPKLHALVHGIFWSGFTLLGLSIIVAYFRERLFVNSEAITKYGYIRLTKIDVADVVEVAWKGTPKMGKIIVRSQLTSIKIDLSNYKSDDRCSLIQFFHDNFPVSIQDGWLQFSELSRPQKVQTPQESLRFALICALVLFGFGAFSISCWLDGLGVRFLVIGVISSVAGLWYLHRRSRFRNLSKTRAENGQIPREDSL